ncbi:MAG: MarR family transcriptional regulator [Bacilli bacterium]|nr:MarR family transcriptional regulator [Bacilli bacterium]
MNNFDCLKLENQLCFPLYAASKEVIKKYKPYLDKYGLTYTQYIALMVLWNEREINVKQLGEKLFLDSGTLTPLLKKLEAKGLIKRNRSLTDERNLMVSITNEGDNLKEKLASIPFNVGKCISLNEEEAKTLYTLLYKVLKSTVD